MQMHARHARYLIAALAFLLVSAGAQSGAADFAAPAARAAPQYSTQDEGTRGQGIKGPASSARPGEYFFNKGVQAFKKGQVAFAVEMYETSAAYAYKPAQYNLAVIYAKGQGVAIDLPKALAWATLAAERGDKRYAAARDAIHAALTPEQADEADRHLGELSPKYADATAMKLAKSRWKDARLAATGSRVGFVGGLKVGAPGNSIGTSQKADPGSKDSATLGFNAWEATGGKQVDGSIAYRQLRESDNPYDPKFEALTGTVKVGEIDTDADASTSKTGEQSEQ